MFISNAIFLLSFQKLAKKMMKVCKEMMKVCLLNKTA